MAWYHKVGRMAAPRAWRRAMSGGKQAKRSLAQALARQVVSRLCESSCRAAARTPGAASWRSSARFAGYAAWCDIVVDDLAP